MKTNILVSIIVPIYNVSEYLNACVQSVCEQTYSNLEIILVDDGSSDDCPEKCDIWKNKDPRIKVIHKKNGGLSDARNAGLDIATGKYIYFLDGDDSMKPRLIETALKYMMDGADMVAFGYDKVFSDGSIKKVILHAGNTEFDSMQKRFHFLIQELLQGKIGWEAWSRMYSRDLIERYHLRFADNRVIFAEDLYFCLCYCAHAKRIVSIDKSLYSYSIHEDSIMGRDSMKLNIGRMNELAKMVLAHLCKWEECKMLVKHFPVIYYFIIDHVMSKAMQNNKLSLQKFRQMVREDIGNCSFFDTQMKRLPSCRDSLYLFFSGSQTEERISIMRYFIDGNYFALRIRNRFIYKFSDYLDRNAEPMKDVAHQYWKLKKKSKRVFFLATEEYGNIGDNQINESIMDFLHRTLPEHTIYEVTAQEWRVHKPFLMKYMRDNDLIVFAGGGNFGNAYPNSQELRNEIIRLWPQNPKIVFPQTIYFSHDPEGERMLDEACALYTLENHIVLFTREQTSFAFAKTYFNCKSYLVPDIVLATNMFRENVRNDQILVCFRHDIEKDISEEETAEIERICKSTNLVMQYTDLQLDYNVEKKDRKAIIKEKFDLWSQSKLVITDRLHGMIFAAITGTPCIVFSNYNHKVQGTYEWIKYLPYICYAETATDVERYLPKLLEMENCTYDNTPLMPYFEKIAEVVRNYANY